MRATRRLERLLLQPTVILLALAGAACLGSLYTSPMVLGLGLALLLAVALGLIWPSLAVLGLRGGIRFHGVRCRVGEPIALTVSLRNWAPWPVWAAVIDPWGQSGAAVAPAAGGQAALGVGVAFVAPFGRYTQQVNLAAPARGVFPIAPATVGCRFPFGLRTARQALPVERPLTVWPARVTAMEFDDGGGQATAVGTRFRDRPGHAGEILGSREYRPGDALAQIHWRQTARLDRLIVCERQSPARPELQLVLDLDPAAYRTGGAEVYEYAVAILAALAEWSFARGAKIDLLVGDRLVEPTRTALLDRLAQLPTFAQLGADQAIPSQRQLGPARATRMIVTTPEQLADRWSFGQASHWVTVSARSAAASPAPWPVWWALQVPERWEAGHADRA